MITIALPSRGRLYEGTIQLFSHLGFDLSFTRSTRSLSQNSSDGCTRIALINPKDAGTLVVAGFVDIAVSALDLLAEYTCNLQDHFTIPLPFGHCQIVMAASILDEGTTPHDFANARIATSYPNLTKRWAREIDLDIDVVPLHGAVEVANVLGVADAIIESHETGITLMDNRLKLICSIMSSQAVLIGNRRTYERPEIRGLIRQMMLQAL